MTLRWSANLIKVSILTEEGKGLTINSEINLIKEPYHIINYLLF
jgi:hypothetical protein